MPSGLQISITSIIFEAWSEWSRKIGRFHRTREVLALHPVIHLCKLSCRRPWGYSYFSYKCFEIDTAPFAFVNPIMQGIVIVQRFAMWKTIDVDMAVGSADWVVTGNDYTELPFFL